MSAPDENGWMPIETAPKDETEILLHDGKQHGIGYFSFPAGVIEWGHWYGTRAHRPTHWQPLPKPPANPHEGG